MQTENHEPIVSHVRVDSARRVVLPSAVCRALGILPGDGLTLFCTTDGVQLRTVEQAVRDFQELCAPGRIAGQSIVEELLAERKASAENE